MEMPVKRGLDRVGQQEDDHRASALDEPIAKATQAQG